MARRALPFLILVTTVLAVAVAAPPSSAGPVPVAEQAQPAAACPPSPFPAGLDAALRRRWPGQRFTASVTDRASGCTWDLRPAERLTTASVMKAEILAGVLLRAQAAGRGVTPWEHERIGPMISTSADPEAQALWLSLGGVAGMQQVDAAFGLTQTTQRQPWGLTTTSARDRTRLMRLLVADDGGPLRAEYRAIARRYLLAVVPSQRWGITAGVRPGTPVPMKNGFFSSQCCRWRVNSSGLVEAAGGGYAITILSDHWPSLAAGIPAVELISRSVAARLGGRFAPFASPAAFVERQFRDVLGRAPTFDEMSWVTAVVAWDTGRAPAQVAGLLGSSGYTALGHPLLRIYQAALHRWPDGPRFAYRMYQLRRGTTSLRAIAEEAARGLSGPGGTTPEAFADVVARAVTGRPADAAGRTYWADRLRNGSATRGDVLRAHVDAPTVRRAYAAAVEVGSAYLLLLGRPPEDSAVAHWADRFASGATVTDLAATIYRSPEYRARVGG